MKKRIFIVILAFLLLLVVAHVLIARHLFYTWVYDSSIVFNMSAVLFDAEYDVAALEKYYGVDETKSYFMLISSQEEVEDFEREFGVDLPDYNRSSSYAVSFNAQASYAKWRSTVNQKRSSFLQDKIVFDVTVIPEFIEEGDVGTLYVYPCFYEYEYLGLYDVQGNCYVSNGRPVG